MGAIDKDRYMSIVDSNTKNAVTADDRFEQIKRYWPIVLDRPFFGHGIGTSREANANLAGYDQPAHDLYIEVGEELGLVGLLIYILFIRSLFVNITEIAMAFKKTAPPGSYLLTITKSIQVYLLLALIFSFASYGLSLDTWYLIAGFTVVVANMANVDHPKHHETGKIKIYQSIRD